MKPTYRPCRKGDRCQYLQLPTGCNWWHAWDTLAPHVQRFLMTHHSALVKFLYQHERPAMCFEASGRPCPRGRAHCDRVHSDQLDPPDVITFIISHMEDNFILNYTNLQEAEYIIWERQCALAKAEFQWHYEHWSMSEAGILLPEYEGHLDYLEIDERYHRERLLYGAYRLPELRASFNMLRGIIKQKERINEQVVVTKRSIIEEYDGGLTQFYDIRKSLYIINDIPIAQLTPEDACSICGDSSANEIVEMLLISEELVCKDCALKYLKSLLPKDILRGVLGFPCIAPLSHNYTRYINARSLIVSIRKLIKTIDELGQIIDIQDRINDIATNGALLLVRQQVEIECQALGYRQLIIKRMTEALTLYCPNPQCKRAYTTWVACAALTCAPADGPMLPGYCGKESCGVCGELVQDGEDSHDHVSRCIPKTIGELVALGVLSHPTDTPTYFISEGVQEKVILLRKIKAIHNIAKDLPPEDRAWALAEMGNMHRELLTPGYKFLE